MLIKKPTEMEKSPILVHFSKYLPTIHTLDNYYCILSSSEFNPDTKSLKINEEMNKSDEKLFSPLFKSVKTSTDSFYI
jgi:hypothetical protein